MAKPYNDLARQVQKLVAEFKWKDAIKQLEKLLRSLTKKESRYKKTEADLKNVQKLKNCKLAHKLIVKTATRLDIRNGQADIADLKRQIKNVRVRLKQCAADKKKIKRAIRKARSRIHRWLRHIRRWLRSKDS